MCITAPANCMGAVCQFIRARDRKSRSVLVMLVLLWLVALAFWTFHVWNSRSIALAELDLRLLVQPFSG